VVVRVVRATRVVRARASSLPRAPSRRPVRLRARRRFVLSHSSIITFTRSYSNSTSSEQKWSKGKTKEKLNNLVLFDQATYEKLLKEVPTYKLITPSVISERLKINGS